MKNKMRILVKRIDKNDRECYPYESGWITVIVKGENLDTDSVEDFLYHNGVNMGDYHGGPGQYFQSTYFRTNNSKTRAKVHINFGYDV